MRAGACGSCHACPMHHLTSGTWQKHVANRDRATDAGCMIILQGNIDNVNSMRVAPSALKSRWRCPCGLKQKLAVVVPLLLQGCWSVSSLLITHRSSIFWCSDKTARDQWCRSHHQISPLDFVSYHSSFSSFSLRHDVVTFTQPKEKTCGHAPHLWLLSTSRIPLTNHTWRPSYLRYMPGQLK